jgi:type IV pilus assembly protein PilE
MMTSNKGSQGFSLIELLLSLALMVLIGSVAVPGFRSAILRAHRSDGLAAMMRLQLQQERFYLERGRYAHDAAELTSRLGAAVGSLHYDIAVQSVNDDRFSIVLQAIGPQRADRPDCWRLAIDERGARSPGESSGCWR